MCWQKWKQESSVKLIKIKGAGEKAFCCGGDVRGNCQMTELVQYISYGSFAVFSQACALFSRCCCHSAVIFTTLLHRESLQWQELWWRYCKFPAECTSERMFKISQASYYKKSVFYDLECISAFLSFCSFYVITSFPVFLFVMLEISTFFLTFWIFQHCLWLLLTNLF